MRFTEEEEESWGKVLFKHFPEAGLVTVLYFTDVIFDILSTEKLYRAEQWWWCGVSGASIILPEFGIGLYIAVRIYLDNVKKNIKQRSERKKNNPHGKEKQNLRIFGIVDKPLSGKKEILLVCLLFLMTPLMAMPFFTLPYLSYKSYKALRKTSEADKHFARSIIYELMKIKAMEALFQSVPQLSLSSFIVMHTMHCDQLEAINATNASFCEDVMDYQENEDIDYLITFISALVSLTTLCYTLSGFEYEKKIDHWRRTGFFPAFFLAICARITACGVMGSWDETRALWFAPPLVACLISFIGLLITRKLAKEPMFVLNKYYLDLDLLSHVLYGGLLLAIPTIDGILVCCSYIGWAVWFYVGTEVDIRYEALAVTVVMQTISMAFVFILRSFGYNVLLFRSNKSEDNDNGNELEEVDSNRNVNAQNVYTIDTNLTTQL